MNSLAIKDITAAKQEPVVKQSVTAHPYGNNIVVQKFRYQKLLQQIKRKHNCPNILLIGPGCVKLAVRLSKYTDKQVIAINLPATEIKENKNEYTGISNLQLSSQNLDGKLMNNKLFEMIIFCSTIEYFFSVNAVLKKALKHFEPCRRDTYLRIYF